MKEVTDFSVSFILFFNDSEEVRKEQQFIEIDDVSNILKNFKKSFSFTKSHPYFFSQRIGVFINYRQYLFLEVRKINNSE